MKKWYQSRTLWVNIVAGAGSIGLAFGVDLGLTPEIQASIVGGVLSVVNIILRLITSEGIGNA